MSHVTNIYQGDNSVRGCAGEIRDLCLPVWKIHVNHLRIVLKCDTRELDKRSGGRGRRRCVWGGWDDEKAAYIPVCL